VVMVGDGQWHHSSVRRSTVLMLEAGCLVDLRQLTAVVTVAEVGSVTKAARLLHLVQPAVTRQIQLLEQEMGVQLFERTPQGMTLTSEGEVLVERARRALYELERARSEIQPDPGGEVTGIVTVGMLESTIDIMVPRLVSGVRDRHPAIRLRIVTAYSGHLQRWLDDGDVDISLLYNLAETPSLAVLPLLEERLWAVAPPGAGLRATKAIRWAKVFQHPLVLPAAGHGLRALIDRARSAVPVEPTVAAETNSMYVQKCLVDSGHGWTILPAAGIAGDLAAGRFSAAPLTHPDVSRALVIGHQRSARTSRPVQAVTREIVRLAGELAGSRAWPSAKISRIDPVP
jgi:LysR family transcriptional regulator, nitrogen assimilation regulatory protein